MEYLVHILIFIALYTILAVSLDLVAGHAGLLSLAQSAFYGVGAYSSALLTTEHHLCFLAGLSVGMVIAVAMSYILSLPSLRLRGDYFVVATFAFQMIMFSLFNNWISLTHGPLGINDIPQPLLFGWHVQSQLDFLLLIGGLAAIIYFLFARLAKSPFGRVLRAIREDEVFAQAMGKNTFGFKVVAFAASAATASIGGSLYAHYLSYIDPSSFSITDSIFIVSMIIIGGAGSLLGPLVGAVILVLLPELLRFVGFPITFAANMRQIIYGALLVVFVIVRPQGLVSRPGFNR